MKKMRFPTEKLNVQRARDEAQRIIVDAQRRARDMQRASMVQATRIKVRAQRDAKRVHRQTVAATQTALRLFRINVANTLTLFNGVCGFFSILATMQHQYMLAASFILAGVLFDVLDGKAARFFGEASLLGKELDSLSDFVTFGVAPAVLVALIEPSFFSFGAGALFVLSAAVRLGRFNIQQMQNVYYGVPTTVNGIVLPLMIFVGAPRASFAWYLVIMALLMNAPVQIKKVF